MQSAVEPAAGVSGGAQYLTFTLGEENYGIDILRVREIKGLTPVTPIPGAPRFVPGVMNLRGSVIPVVDLRLRFGLPAADDSRFRVVIVATVLSPPAEKTVGLLVDAVSQVMEFEPGRQIQPPDFGSRGNTRFVRGMATLDDRLVVLIDLEPLWEDTAEVPPPAESGAAGIDEQGDRGTSL